MSESEIVYEYAGFKYIITEEDGQIIATPLPGQHPAAAKDKHLRAKNANETLQAASSPDHKLAVLANYGDLAIQLLPRLAREIECLRLLIPESE